MIKEVFASYNVSLLNASDQCQNLVGAYRAGLLGKSAIHTARDEGQISKDEARALLDLVSESRAAARADRHQAAFSDLRSVINRAGLGGLVDCVKLPDGRIAFMGETFPGRDASRLATVARTMVSVMAQAIAGAAPASDAGPACEAETD